MRQDSLKFKVGLYLALVLSPAVILIPYLIVQHQEEHLHDVMTTHATRIAEVVVRSTRHAMMSNRRELASRIVDDIGKQEGIDVIRIVDKDGIIVHSSKTAERGHSIGQKDEPCVNCHRNGKPPSQLAADQRWRIYRNPDGERILGAMEVIRNEPTCSSAACHQHPPGQSVLGIVDIGYSLGPLDRTLGRHAWVIGSIALTVILLVG
ncbi:MAG TPA: hypothetical protein VFV17_04050, partial [Usitatibacteraceae bacterium]|nr:hypothetical protein [Usitatibacteraceae bacterium]